MGFRFEVWDPPGIATFTKKIAGLHPVTADGTLYRRQVGRASFTLPTDFSRLDEIVYVDTSDHSNDVSSLLRVYRGSDLIQELLIDVSPNVVAGQPAQIHGDSIEAILDWAVVEAKDWLGEADEYTTNPDWIYGGRNLIPDLSLGNLGSIRETWELYLSGEAYILDLSSATSGTFTLTAAGGTTGAIAYNATGVTINNALEALGGITTVSVVQDDPDVASFLVVFEDPKDLVANATANFGSLGGSATFTKQNDGFDTSLNPTFTITVDGQTTSALAWDASATQVEGSPLTGNGLEGLSNVDDVSVSGSGIASDPWIITFYAPPDPTTLSVTFAAGTASFTKTQEGDPDPSPVTKSQTVDASIEPGIHGCDPTITVVTTPLDTGADWSLRVSATCRYDGSQIVLPVKAGQTYQASINIRPTVSGYYTLVIRDEFENLIKNPTPRDNYLTAGSFQTISVSDIVIPPGVERIILRAAVTDPNSSAWATHYVNWQGAVFQEGEQATTAGQIWLDLLADAQTEHASSTFARSTLSFLNASFDATNDSNGNAWTDSQLSVTIPRGMTYRKVAERIFGGLGYEYTITPTSGTPGEWDLNVYNPDGRGTDHSAAATPSLLLGQGTLSGSATRSIPRSNILRAEGAQQYISRTEDSASYGAVGRREGYLIDVTYTEAQVEDWVDKQLARFLDASFQPRFDIVDSDDWPVPVVSYGLADTLNVDLADGAGKVSREVEAISWREEDGVVWTIHTGEAQFDAPTGGGGGGGSASIASSGPVDEGVRRLLDAFDLQRPVTQPFAFVPSKGGGELSVAVAASNASELEKAKADFICSGSNDDQTILAAFAAMGGFGGRIKLSSGLFSIQPDQLNFQTDLWLQGAGFTETVLQIQGAGVGVEASSVCDIKISDLQFAGLSTKTGKVAIYANGGDTFLRDIWFNTVETAVQLEANYARMSGLRSQGTSITNLILASGGVRAVTLSDCYSGGYVRMGNTINVVINNNVLGASIVGSDCRGWVITNNVWEVTSIFDASLIDLGVDNSGDTGVDGGCLVVGNACGVDLGYDFVAADSVVGLVVGDNYCLGGGVNLLSCSEAVIKGNRFDLVYEAGVNLVTCDNALVADNSISYNDFGSTTYDVIQITTSDRVLVTANSIRSGNLTPDYGVNVVSGECNMVVGNDLGDKDTYAVDALADTGANTQLTYPGDMTYGDNFTDCGTGS